MGDVLRVASAQAEAVPGDLAANTATAARLAVRAAAEGVRLLVLPELFLPAYHPPTLAADASTDVAADEAGTVADPRLDPLRSAASAHGIVIVVGAAVRRPEGRRTLSCLVVDRSGAARAAYDKQHLWGPDEKALFSPGEAGATLTLDGWRLALGICYDGCFPEHGRAAAGAGADAYLCPAAYLDGSQHRRDLYYAARALDNTMYVVFSNVVGGPAGWRFNGGAAVYDPEGRPLVRAPDTGEDMVTADLARAGLTRVRARHTMLADRRPLPPARHEIVVA